MLEGPEDTVKALIDSIKKDPRHDSVEIREAGDAPARLFKRWAMALVLEHHEPDQPLIGNLRRHRRGSTLARHAGTGGRADAVAGYDAGVWAGVLSGDVPRH